MNLSRPPGYSQAERQAFAKGAAKAEAGSAVTIKALEARIKELEAIDHDTPTPAFGEMSHFNCRCCLVPTTTMEGDEPCE